MCFLCFFNRSFQGFFSLPSKLLVLYRFEGESVWRHGFAEIATLALTDKFRQVVGGNFAHTDKQKRAGYGSHHIVQKGVARDGNIYPVVLLRHLALINFPHGGLGVATRRHKAPEIFFALYKFACTLHFRKVGLFKNLLVVDVQQGMAKG